MKKVTIIWCMLLQAAARIKTNLGALTSSQSKKIYENLANISKEVVGNGGLIHQHPLGF